MGTGRKQLRDRHLALLRERFQTLVDAKMYKNADEVGLKMLARYPDNSEVLRDVYGLQLRSTKEVLKAPSDDQLVKLRESLLLYERLPGKKQEGLINDTRKMLKDRATALVAEAKDLDSKKMTAAALAALRTAELLDPELPSIADARIKLRGKVLYVGVAKLPEKMSPATAELDSEHWASELSSHRFSIPDSEVIRYRPALAEGMPAVMPHWAVRFPPTQHSGAKRLQVGAGTLATRGTLDLLRRPAYRDRWCADGLEVFEEIDHPRPVQAAAGHRRWALEPLAGQPSRFCRHSISSQTARQADDDSFSFRSVSARGSS